MPVYTFHCVQGDDRSERGDFLLRRHLHDGMKAEIFYHLGDVKLILSSHSTLYYFICSYELNLHLYSDIYGTHNFNSDLSPKKTVHPCTHSTTYWSFQTGYSDVSCLQLCAQFSLPFKLSSLSPKNTFFHTDYCPQR